MTKSELKDVIKESLQELLFDSKIIETLMVEVISKVSRISEVTAMGAGVGAVEASVANDEFDLESVEEPEKAPEEKLAENIASFWGKALGSDPAFGKMKVEARGKSYTPTEQSQGLAKNDPAFANLRKASQIQIGGVPIFDQSNFTSEESDLDLGPGSFMSKLLGSKKVQESLERLVE
jgi:hypothetical protein